MSTRRARMAAVAATIAAAFAIGAVGGLIAARDDGESAPRREAQGRDAQRPEAPEPSRREDGSASPEPKGARLKPVVAGRPGAGRARISESGRRARLELSVSGLPALEEEYVVWLYNSVTESRRLGAFVAGRFRLSRTLPAGATRYRWIDVSREPLDGNPNHSGESVLRVSLAQVQRASR